MTVKELLDFKRVGGELPADEIRALVAAYAADEVPDYQMAAFAMAVCCRGMSPAETFALTDAMRLSGAQLDWTGFPPSADKHSTGGVGDKLSLVIQPLAAACGLAVPSLTGRGLGHTGGTADKLESIPGYNAALSLDRFREVVRQCGVSMTVQTEEICPADRRLYSLRDVTGTVPSIPLIVGSILSKKLAEGADTLVFDVKCGEGAFMKTRDEAVELARALVGGARDAGRRAAALVTAMDEPLGRSVGNALEVDEAIAVLKGAEVPVVAELSVEFAAVMVSLAKELPLDAARAMCRERLQDGSAFARFEAMAKLQGGDLGAFMSREAAPTLEVRAGREGYVERIAALEVAAAALHLGAGREQLSDVIDPSAGVELMVGAGDKVAVGATIARVHATARADRLENAAAMVAAAVKLADAPPPRQPVILERI